MKMRRLFILVFVLMLSEGCSQWPRIHFGRGVSAENSAEQLTRPAEKGDPAAQYQLGRKYHDGDGVTQNYTEANKWFLKAAEQGLPEGQFAVGNAYLLGEGVRQDGAEAALWFRKAADKGLGIAQCNLGVMYTNGQGMPRDYAEGLKWLTKAADLGTPAAQYNLGWAYENGRGVPIDYVQAHVWYSLAESQNYSDSAHRRGLVAQKMTPVQVARAIELMQTWKQDFAKRQPPAK
jgi:TPR repeat protein